MVRAEKIGVVTVTYNSGDIIDDFMASILSQTHNNFVLYIVDNASTDTTLDKLSGYKDERIVILPNKLNVGVAAGNNQGIRASLDNNCEYVLLINNDTVFNNELLHSLLSGLKKYQCDMTVPKIMYYDDPKRIWFAGGYFSKLKFYYNVHVGFNQVDSGQYDNVTNIEYAPTCCMLIKSTVFDKIDLMDEKYFVYFDDVDFCYRAKKHRLIMKLLPELSLYHKVSSSTGGQYTDFSIKYGNRNRVYFICKNIPVLKNVVVLYMILSLTKQFVINGYSASQFALSIKSILEGYRMLTADK
ncbi:low-salt glycan biosynthesis hexosyltransferase Agl10 [Geobacter sp. OR-1]|uniref:glycosyltransferase family 2 protein n=1 Tax=Geobacter sp. OR-1 TaxID=1266765 RepID=UPI00054349BD|nr:glycosyltransferase family 2 protein [Geobacter sp. OR-1]GAM08239.1 low-salt glycan biosynthesis hexosyltransferase Agl10 [Geobacter sp. OR-1]